MEVGPEKCGRCSERTANAGGILWRYSGEARTMAFVAIPAGPVQLGHPDLTVLNAFPPWGLLLSRGLMQGRLDLQPHHPAQSAYAPGSGTWESIRPQRPFMPAMNFSRSAGVI
jgi:hypothetical protein